MNHRSFSAVSGEARGKSGGGITLDHHAIDRVISKKLRQARQDPGGYVGQIPPWEHHTQIHGQLKTKQLENLTYHLPMLAGGVQQKFDFRPMSTRLDDRRQLDRFRSRSEHSHQSHRHKESEMARPGQAKSNQCVFCNFYSTF